jgi:hypothetical protein
MSAAQRSAILGGARDACATAANLGETVAKLRSEAVALRRESERLRGLAQADRDERRRPLR